MQGISVSANSDNAATAVAFAGQPEMVLARFVASLLACVVVGWIWVRFGRADWLRLPARTHAPGASKLKVFRESMLHDMMHAGGYLVVGAAAAATLNVIVPRAWLMAVAKRRAVDRFRRDERLGRKLAMLGRELQTMPVVGKRQRSAPVSASAAGGRRCSTRTRLIRRGSASSTSNSTPSGWRSRCIWRSRSSPAATPSR